MSTAVLLTGVAMLTATALLYAHRLVPRSLVGVLLAAYVLAFAEVVAVALSLSAVGRLAAGGFLACELLLLVPAVALAIHGTSDAQALRNGVAHGRAALRDPLLAGLATAVVLALGYCAALGAFTAQNDWDSLTYHLARAAFWIQEGEVGYVAASDVIRINVNPPHAEIGAAVTMLLGDGDRFVFLPQFAATVACAVGIAGIARRIGLETKEATIGGLLFVSLPVVLLQSSTALNDVVVASFLVVATYFLLGSTRVDLVLGATSIALALGTKFSAFIALPLLVAVVLVAQPRRRWPAIGLAMLVGACAGSYWIVLNLSETGRIDGGAGEVLGQHPDRSIPDTAARATRMLVSFVDDLNLGDDLWLYPLVAAAVAAAVVAGARGRKGSWPVAAGAVALGFLPLALATVREYALRTHEKLFVAIGRQDLAFIYSEREAASPSPLLSYYGPVGFALVLAGLVTAVLAWRRGTLPRTALVLAAAPLAIVLLVAVAVSYDPLRARFLVYGLALAAATWGLVLRYRWLAVGAASMAAVTLVLTFVHSVEKPAGVVLLDATTSASVWGLPREVVQTWLRPDGAADTVAYFAGEPDTGRVGLRLREDDWPYPYFGPTLGREVVFVENAEDGTSVDWLVRAPGRRVDLDWPVAVATDDGWTVLRNPRS